MRSHIYQAALLGISITAAASLNAATPSITNVTPSQIDAGSANATVTITGANFTQSSTVYIQTPTTHGASIQLPLTYVSPTQVTTVILGGGRCEISGLLSLTVQNGFDSVSNAGMALIQPVLTSLTPNSAPAGSAGVSVTASGKGFLPTNFLRAVGPSGMTIDLTTVYSDFTTLTARFPGYVPAGSGVFSVLVMDANGTSSRALPFTATAATIGSVTPAQLPAGAAGVTITVSGTGFADGSQAIWAGTPLETKVLNSTSLSAAVPPSLLVTSGKFGVTVKNGDGSLSTTFAVYVEPVLAAIDPRSAMAGGSGMAVTATGAGFTSADRIQVAGSGAIPTTFASSTSLTAQIPAQLLAATGSLTLSVVDASSGTASAGLAFTVESPAPSISAVVNWASSLPAIAPGSLIAIYGKNLGTGTASFLKLPLPQTLAGATVTIGGKAIPLLFASATQINAQVPYEIAPGKVELAVHANGFDSEPADVTVTPTAPGLLTAAASNHVLALNVADGSQNSLEHPAAPGTYVTAYVTGQGQVDRAVASGDAAPLSPLSMPLAEVDVTIGGQTAVVQFAGLAPGYVGLMQMNVLVPAAAGGEQSLVVTIGGVASQSAVISVGGKS